MPLTKNDLRWTLIAPGLMAHPGQAGDPLAVMNSVIEKALTGRAWHHFDPNHQQAFYDWLYADKWAWVIAVLDEAEEVGSIRYPNDLPADWEDDWEDIIDRAYGWRRRQHPLPEIRSLEARHVWKALKVIFYDID